MGYDAWSPEPEGDDGDRPEYCYDCRFAPCRCDDLYEAWKDRQMERELNDRD